MGTDNIPARSGGQTITAQFFNLLRSVLGGDLVPRNASGVPMDLAGAIGTSTYRMLSAFAQKYNLGAVASGLSIEEDSGAIIFKVGGTEKMRISSSLFDVGAGVDFGDDIISRDALKNDLVFAKSSAVNFSSAATSWTDVTNATVTINRTGKPVLVFYEGDVRVVGVVSSRVPRAEVRLLRGATQVADFNYDRYLPEGTPTTFTHTMMSPSGIIFLDTTTTTGSTTYKLQVQNNGSGGSTTQFSNGNGFLVACEL